jgi:hypothetical protein
LVNAVEALAILKVFDLSGARACGDDNDRDLARVPAPADEIVASGHGRVLLHTLLQAQRKRAARRV